MLRIITNNKQNNKQNNMKYDKDGLPIAGSDNLPMTSSERQKKYRNEMKTRGYVQQSFWIKPGWREKIKQFLKDIEK